MRKKGTNIFAYTAAKLLLALLTLWVMQLLFYLFNQRIFHLTTIDKVGIAWGNIVFGLATIGTFFAPFTLLMLLPTQARWKRWYRIVCEVLYVLAMVLIIVPRGANMAYYQYTYRLLSDEIFSYLGISGQMGSLLPHFAIDYWYAWVMPLLVFVLFLVANSRLRLGERNHYFSHTANDLVGMAVGVLLLWFAARGGFGHWLRANDSVHYAQPKATALVSNDSYNILRTLFTPDLDEPDPSDIGDYALTTYNSPQPRLAATPDEADSTEAPKPRNVVLIIVESLGQEFMGCYNTQDDAETRTPFLDSLAQHCTLYNGRSNGKKSIEGITAITTSIPNLMSCPFTNSIYATDTFIGLPTILKRHGYSSAFFHGSYNGVMDFDKTCARIGFDQYLGMNEYNASPDSRSEDYDGVWGIFDEPFLQYTARHIGTFSEPFLAEVFTVTSHHPFPIPKGQEDLYSEGRHPILKCVEYTDNALRQFFNTARRQPWYDNTLFIITGDHSGHGLTPEYNDYDGWYRIPLMVFDPQHPEGTRSDRIVQQTDLMPSIVDWLGIEGEHFVTFGTSVVQEPRIGRQVYYGNGYYVMVSNTPHDPALHDLTIIMEDFEMGSDENIELLRRLVAQYKDRIINNKLIAE